MDNNKTGSFIAECRKELGYSQKELAEKLNITDKAVSKWETGRSAPDVSILIPLAEKLGVSVTEILNGERISEDKMPTISNEIIVKSLKKSKSKKMLALILALVLLISIFVSYLIYVYTNSFEVYDLDSIATETSNMFNIEKPIYANFEMKGDYSAYLYYDNESSYVVLFKQNKLFKNRMDLVGGTSADLSELGLYSTSGYGENINIFFAAGTDAERYEFSIMEVDYSVPIYDKDFVNIFVEKSNIYYHATDFEFVE